MNNTFFHIFEEIMINSAIIEKTTNKILKKKDIVWGRREKSQRCLRTHNNRLRFNASMMR